MWPHFGTVSKSRIFGPNFKFNFDFGRGIIALILDQSKTKLKDQFNINHFQRVRLWKEIRVLSTVATREINGPQWIFCFSKLSLWLSFREASTRWALPDYFKNFFTESTELYLTIFSSSILFVSFCNQFWCKISRDAVWHEDRIWPTEQHTYCASGPLTKWPCKENRNIRNAQFQRITTVVSLMAPVCNGSDSSRSCFRWLLISLFGTNKRCSSGAIRELHENGSH